MERAHAVEREIGGGERGPTKVPRFHPRSLEGSFRLGAVCRVVGRLAVTGESPYATKRAARKSPRSGGDSRTSREARGQRPRSFIGRASRNGHGAHAQRGHPLAASRTIFSGQRRVGLHCLSYRARALARVLIA